MRSVLLSVAPRWGLEIMSARTRAHSQRMLASWGCGPVNRKLFEKLGTRVLGGPFAGLLLTDRLVVEQIGPYLLGVYESEIHEAWAVVFRKNYKQILDIGAKFGYYAVGLALRYPQADVVAFDTDWWARRALHEVAAANHVRNLDVRGLCSPDWLLRHLRPGALVVSDCEGYETTVLQPDRTESLRSATVIVESHDAIVPQTTERLMAALGATHRVRSFSSGVSRSAPEALDFLAPEERAIACQEVRSPTVWLLCIPREHPES